MAPFAERMQIPRDPCWENDKILAATFVYKSLMHRFIATDSLALLLDVQDIVLFLPSQRALQTKFRVRPDARKSSLQMI